MRPALSSLLLNQSSCWRKSTSVTHVFVEAEKLAILQKKNNSKHHSISIRSFSSAMEPAHKMDVAGNSSKSEDTKDGAKEQPRKLSEVPISEVLKAKHTLRWVEPVICQESTIREAIIVCIERGLSGMMVVDREETTSTLSKERGKVVGMTTSRDLLRMLSYGIKEGESADKILEKKIDAFMTPISQVIYGRPDETIGTCRTIMAKLGVKCLPILANGRVEGLITARDMSDYGLDAKDLGGKKNFLKDVSERVGLHENTSMAEPPLYLKAQLSMKENPIFINVGVAELPHPFKTHDGCKMNRRDFGAENVATDPRLSEDAYFVREISFPDENGVKSHDVVYMGVADGVGSWREYGVDPRDFAAKLMEECDNALINSVTESHATGGKRKGHSLSRIITPSDILAKAYERVKDENIIGSSTACVALFDSISHQLHFSNLGDSGIIVLRHIDSDIAGALKRDRVTPRLERKSDLRVAFVSQQQLISFNHPFQFGWTGEDTLNGDSAFKTATDCCSTSIHVRRGDIIIMATDGLFDNVDIDEIAQIGLEWEVKHGFIRNGDILAREERWAKGNSMTSLSAEKIPELAQTLCERAREQSLNTNIDSPFALLAKENDIMWSGGMPDDCTVIAMQVVGKPRHL